MKYEIQIWKDSYNDSYWSTMLILNDRHQTDKIARSWAREGFLVRILTIQA